MKIFAEVVVPGPWWNKLTYLSESPLSIGVRVNVNVGRSSRTGLISRIHSDENSLEFDISRIRTINSVVDETPVLPPDIWYLTEWAGRVYFCGQGEALSVACPSNFLKGARVATEGSLVREHKSVFNARFVFSADDRARYADYMDAIRDSEGPSMIIFPEQIQAERFFRSLTGSIKENSILWPYRGGKKLWDTWNSVRAGFSGLLVGTQGAAFAPVRDLSLIIVEEESSGAYIQQKYPFLNVKSILAKRAEFCKCDLVLGGRLPSSRVYLNSNPVCHDKLSVARAFFVDMRSSIAPNLAGVTNPFRLSETALRETSLTLKQNKVALWILDRKGYVGEVACEECGRSIECSGCGGTYSWNNETDNLKCAICGAEIKFPRECPYCRGALITGRRAGIDALYQVANELIISSKPVVKWHSTFPGTREESRKLKASLAEGGLVIGSRLALVLCDTLSVGSVTWIDADSEARKPFYNSHFKALSMIWESCWRGESTGKRKVIVQSRIPGKGWQKGLLAGWDYFWKRELRERKELELPPFAYLLQIDCPDVNVKEEIAQSFLENGLDVMDPGKERNDSFRIWVSSKKLNPVISVLEPYFRISRSGFGFPVVRMYSD